MKDVKAYNVSFQMTFTTGPTNIKISYEMGHSAKALGMSPSLLVNIESHQTIHPHSLLSHYSKMLPPGNWKLQMLNIAKVSALQIEQVDIGNPYIVMITLRSHLYCSSGGDILQQHDDKYMHHQRSPYMAMMIHEGRTSRDINTCTEVIVTHITKEATSYITEVFLNIDPQGRSVQVVVSNEARPEEENEIVCNCNETIIMTEFHYDMNIVYTYTFYNTATQKRTWYSILGSDIHLLITKQIRSGGDKCQKHIKIISLEYGTEPHLGLILRNYSSLPASFNHYAAR
jgi:hypothetical protein